MRFYEDKTDEMMNIEVNAKFSILLALENYIQS
jgi:hypothetical protein